MEKRGNISITTPVHFTEVVWQYSCPFEWVNSITLKENQVRRSYSRTLYTYTLVSSIANVDEDELPYKIVIKVYKKY